MGSAVVRHPGQNLKVANAAKNLCVRGVNKLHGNQSEVSGDRDASEPTDKSAVTVLGLGKAGEKPVAVMLKASGDQIALGTLTPTGALTTQLDLHTPSATVDDRPSVAVGESAGNAAFLETVVTDKEQDQVSVMVVEYATTTGLRALNIEVNYSKHLTGVEQPTIEILKPTVANVVDNMEKITATAQLCKADTHPVHKNKDNGLKNNTMANSFGVLNNEPVLIDIGMVKQLFD